MKIVFCGPPHSGKSVFIANIERYLPSDGYTVIRGCPDGEGGWSNNENQNITQLVRKKGKFTPEFVQEVNEIIDRQENPIIIVDVGGIRSKENKEIFSHCDAFVVLSSSQEETQKWKEFGEETGLQCLAIMDSVLEGEEAIYETEPFLRGLITGLERGTYLNNSEILKKLTDIIVSQSKYKDFKKDKTNVLNVTELGDELGCGESRTLEDGTVIKSVNWKQEVSKVLYEKVFHNVNGSKKVKIDGARATWVLGNIVSACQDAGIEDISAYDIRTTEYIPIKKLETVETNAAKGLEYTVVESDQSVFLDVDIPTGTYAIEDYDQCVIPTINEDKPLYVSGRLPLWLYTAIATSYDSTEIYAFQPGIGFTCFDTKNPNNLGKIVQEPEGIDLVEYFEAKKGKTISNPTINPKKPVSTEIDM